MHPHSQKFHHVIDLQYGSSAKGATSPRLADYLGMRNVSSHHFANAGHTYIHGDFKFVGKAVPTPTALNKTHAYPMRAFLSPGSGFSPIQLLTEWIACDFPQIIIHDRATLILPQHAERERSGKLSTKHLASTMQGCGAAAADKVMRLPDTRLAMDLPDVTGEMLHSLKAIMAPDKWEELDAHAARFFDEIIIAEPQLFRDLTWQAMTEGGMLHEGSQGYGLSIDHGPRWPFSTFRNVDTGMAMSYMAIPPRKVGTVTGVLRAGHMIRVGNVVEGGEVVGQSGPVPEDAHETTWGGLAQQAGMPPEEAAKLLEKELTTVTKRLRRVFTESVTLLQDAVRVNGVDQLAVNFIQYINWEDRGVKSITALSAKSRKYLDHLEEALNVPVVMVGTGADHSEGFFM